MFKQINGITGTDIKNELGLELEWRTERQRVLENYRNIEEILVFVDGSLR